MLEVELGGQRWTLMADGSVWWAAQQILLVADTHFGKEATFRRASIPVPVGATAGTLDILSRAIGLTAAPRVIFLGDLFHAKTSLASAIRDRVDKFFSAHRGVEFDLVRGNHDSATGRLPAEWPLRDLGPRAQIGDVSLAHFPAEPADGSRILLCGHLHPAIRIRHGDEKLGKWSCFWYSARTLVLPAMGEFTGTSVIRPQKNDRVWPTMDGVIFEYRHAVSRFRKAATPVTEPVTE